METRVFDFDVDFGTAGSMIGHLVLRLPGTNTLVRSLDDFIAAGWIPIHWTTLPSEMTHVARYRVIMQRERRSMVAGSVPERFVAEEASN